MSTENEKPIDPARVDALRERLSRVRTALTVWVPFFGHLLLKLDPKIAEPRHGIATAGVTRDRKLFLNVDFCEPLTDAEFAGLLCHETMHLAYLTFERQGTRRAIVVDQNGGSISLFNVAADYAINGIIETMIKPLPNGEVKLPKGGCVDLATFGDWSAEEVYDKLLDDACKNTGKGKGGIVLPGGSWGTDDMRDDLGGDGEESGEDGEGSGRGRSEAENKALDTYWKVAIVEAAQIHEQQQRGKGTLPLGLQKLIDEIVDPKISWVDVLSRWVGENGRRADFTYRRPARRAEAVGEILPALLKHGVDDLVVLWDTSGSMNGRETEILSEVIGICEDLNLALRVICCDTAIHSDQEEVEHPDDVDVKGGGGSNFNPAFDRLHEEGFTGVVVAFTDGYIDVPGVKPPHIRDVLWVLWQGRDVDPTGGKWGETLIVDKDGNQVN